MKCNTIFIVAKISRAVTDQSLKSSLYGVLAKHVPMAWEEAGGKGLNIAVICTRSDDINVRTARAEFCHPGGAIAPEVMAELDAEIEAARGADDRDRKKELKARCVPRSREARPLHVKACANSRATDKRACWSAPGAPTSKRVCREPTPPKSPGRRWMSSAFPTPSTKSTRGRAMRNLSGPARSPTFVGSATASRPRRGTARPGTSYSRLCRACCTRWGCGWTATRLLRASLDPWTHRASLDPWTHLPTTRILSTTSRTLLPSLGKR